MTRWPVLALAPPVAVLNEMAAWRDPELGGLEVVRLRLVPGVIADVPRSSVAVHEPSSAIASADGVPDSTK